MMISRYLINVSLMLAVLFINNHCYAEVEHCRGGECFPSTANFNDKTYPLVGTGLFRYWGFKIYGVALYADPENAAREKILDSVPKRFVLHYFREFSPKDFQESQRVILKSNTSADRNDVELKLKEMDKLYKGVVAGDEYALTYIPGVGTELALNGTPLGVVAGEEFQRAYFGIWLSKNSIKESLTKQILPK
jgi:hypothetical protein